jgi:hypothetical protein
VLPAAQLPEHGKGFIVICRLPKIFPAKGHDGVCAEDPAAFKYLNNRVSFGLGQKPGIRDRIARQGVFADPAGDGAKRNPDLSEKLFSSRGG